MINVIEVQFVEIITMEGELVYVSYMPVLVCELNDVNYDASLEALLVA